MEKNGSGMSERSQLEKAGALVGDLFLSQGSILKWNFRSIVDGVDGKCSAFTRENNETKTSRRWRNDGSNLSRRIFRSTAGVSAQSP